MNLKKNKKNLEKNLKLMKIKCKYSELVEIEKLVPHPKNPNDHSEDQIKILAEGLKFYGIRHPIIVSNQSGWMAAGEARFRAAKINGWKKFPVDFQDFNDGAEEYAFMVFDNAISHRSELNRAKINEDFLDLGPDFDLDLLGIKDFVLEPAEKYDEETEDEVPPEPSQAKSKFGDFWMLGDHRLLCGDARDRNNWDKFDNTDLMITSPPYNVSIQGFQEAKYSSGFENKSDSEYVQFLQDFMGLALLNSKYCFVILQLLASNRLALSTFQFNFSKSLKDILIWVKSQCPPNIIKGAFSTKWEYIYCFSLDSKTRGFPCSWQGKYTNIIESNSSSGNKFASIHKATYPVYLPEEIIRRMDFSQSIMDPFGGTGTTLIACEKTNRKCYMMEIEPKYIDVILSRWAKYTGKDPIREDGTTWSSLNPNG